MKLVQVQAIVAAHRAELAELGMGSLYVFGSVARGEERPDSDVDLLVELNRSMGLFEFAGLKLRLQELLGTEVHLVMVDAIKPQMRDGILGEAVRAA